MFRRLGRAPYIKHQFAQRLLRLLPADHPVRLQDDLLRDAQCQVNQFFNVRVRWLLVEVRGLHYAPASAGRCTLRVLRLRVRVRLASGQVCRPPERLRAQVRVPAAPRAGLDSDTYRGE